MQFAGVWDPVADAARKASGAQPCTLGDYIAVTEALGGRKFSADELSRQIPLLAPGHVGIERFEQIWWAGLDPIGVAEPTTRFAADRRILRNTKEFAAHDALHMQFRSTLPEPASATRIVFIEAASKYLVAQHQWFAALRPADQIQFRLRRFGSEHESPRPRTLSLLTDQSWPSRHQNLPALSNFDSAQSAELLASWKSWKSSFAQAHPSEAVTLAAQVMGSRVQIEDFSPAGMFWYGTQQPIEAIARAQVHHGFIRAKDVLSDIKSLNRSRYSLGDARRFAEGWASALENGRFRSTLVEALGFIRSHEEVIWEAIAQVCPNKQ